MSSNTSSFPHEEQEESSSAGGPSINENWASPSELLEMRTMWSAIVTQHKAEMAAMQAALERSHQQQQTYLQELKETHRLRHLYTAAALDQERIIEERKVWAEEKLLMQQETQRLKLALMKHHHSSANNNTHNQQQQNNNVQGTTGSGPSDTTTATSWTSTTMPSLPSTSTPSSYVNSPHNQTILLAVAQEENVALHEALSRIGKERSELEQRTQFLMTASSMQQRALLTQTQTQSADLVRLQKKIADLTADVHRYATDCVGLREEKMANEVFISKLEATIEEQKESIDREKTAGAAHLGDRLAEVQERLERSHAAEVTLLKRELAEANQARENLRAQVEHGVMSKSANSQASQSRIDELEETIAGLRQALRRLEDESLMASRSHQQLQSEMLDRLQFEAEARQESNAHRTALLMRIDGLESRLCLADAENDRKNAEVEHLQAQTAMLMKEISNLQDAAAATTTAQAMVAELAGELETQKEFYETQILQHAKAMELMQISHTDDKRQLFEMMGPRRERRSSQPPSASKTKNVDGEETGKRSERKAQKEPTTEPKKKQQKNSNIIGGNERRPAVIDALQLMKINAAMAEKCAHSIAHV